MASLEQQSAARQLRQFKICRAGTVANLPADIHKRARGVTRREGFASLNHSRPTNQILSILLSCQNILIDTAKLLGGARKMLKIAITMGALGGAGIAHASMITTSLDQAGDGSKTASEATFYLKNNDTNMTYDSAELKYDELLTGVAQAVQDHNSDYSSMSLGDIMGEWGYGISSPPTGEVKTGWTASLNSGVLNLSHNGGDPNLDYTV
jgi:hypothetical protein